MALMEGLPFNPKTAALITALIDQVKAVGDCSAYFLPNMHKGKGELRLAHHGPDGKHKKSRGVFAELQPRKGEVVVVRRRQHNGGAARTLLLEENLSEVARFILLWRAQCGDKLKGSEKVEPNSPGTVQGGQFESNHSKH